MKRTLFLLLAVLMLVTVSGCSSAATTPTTAAATSAATSAAASASAAATDTSAATATVAPTATAAPSYFKKYDPEITFTQNFVVGPDQKWVNNDTIESNPYTKWVEETCGIKLKTTWISPDWQTDDQKLTIAAASNSLPDVMYTESTVISKLMKAGQIMPLDDLISQYASPLVKYLNDVNVKYTKGKFFQPYIQDGKTYAYAYPYDNAGLWKVNWIRQDILTDLGKAVPTSLAELEDVLAAYKAKYPNGTGLHINKDLNLDIVMEGFNAYPSMWLKDDAGNLAYGSIQPGIKKGLELLNKWYKAGYIDAEFIAQTGDQTNATFTKGDMLTYQGQWWNMYFPFPDLWKNSTTADMAVLPTLKGPDGTGSVMVNAISGWGTCVKNGVKNPEALMYLLNEEMDSMYRPTTYHASPAILEAMKAVNYTFKYPSTDYQKPLNADDKNRVFYTYNYAVKGYGFFDTGYDMGKLVYGFQLSDPSVLVSSTMQKYDDVYNNKIALDKVDPSIRDGYQSLMDTDKRAIKSFASVFEYWNPYSQTDDLKVNENVAPPTATASAKKALLDTMEKEVFAQIIMGTKPLDAFDKFVTDWKANGGDQWTTEVNAWYATTK